MSRQPGLFFSHSPRDMVVRDIQQLFEAWAPPEIAWERDNVGLQIGSSGRRVRRILVALDVSNRVVEEARRKQIDLLISHHPLLFHPLRSVHDDDRIGQLVLKLAQYRISLYSAHTNLDFTHSGVSAALAERLGLLNCAVLSKQNKTHKKVVVFVPSDHVEKVMGAMAKAGAGRVGEYEACSFRTEGIGTFRGLSGTKPFVGKAGMLESVSEVRLEMVVPQWKLSTVLEAMRESHPYEEVAFDVYDLANESQDYGAGVIGELTRRMSLKEFLAHVRTRLRVPALRYTGNSRRQIRSVAVCGGSGSELLQHALHRGADAFVTADVSYHTFERAEGAIALIDAGHFETETPVVQKVVDYLKTEPTIRKENIRIIASQQSRNPVQYYLS